MPDHLHWLIELQQNSLFGVMQQVNARQAARAVRAHWAIENTLHWILEDQSAVG
jgi:predicted transposase YbfD/YdcC